MRTLAGPGDRLAYVHEAAAVLWPGAAVSVARGPATPPATSFLLLPNATRPRLLAPADSRRAAARTVLGYGEAASSADRFRTRMLAAGLRCGAAQRALRDRVTIDTTPGTPSLLGHLGEVLGVDLVVGLYLSAPRANRKPVLQLLDRGGRRIGFAKVGVDPLTRRLVRAETAALHRLATAGLPGLLTPDVMYSGRWQDLEVLVQSPLPLTGRRRPVDTAALTDAMRRVSELDRAPAVALGGTGFWSELTARVDVLPDGPAADGLSAVVTGLSEIAGREPVATGSWHGDWTPWNMAGLAGGLAVWDWERFAGGRPVGFDVLHHALQRDLVSRKQDPAQAVERCLDDAARRLAPFGVPAEAATVTVLCYLTELGVRYTEDGQAEAGARLGRVQDWLVPGLRARAERCRR